MSSRTVPVPGDRPATPRRESGDRTLRARGILFAALTSLSFGAALVVNKVGLEQGALDPLEYTSLSVLVAGVLGLLTVVPRGAALRSCSWPCRLNLLFVGVAASGLAHLLMFWGQSRTRAVNAGFLLSLSTVFTLLFAALLLRERLEKQKLPFVLLLLAGMYLLTVGVHTLRLNPGDLLIVGSAAIWGLTNALSKVAMRQVRGELVAAVRLVVGALFLLAILFFRSPHLFAALDRVPAWYLASGVLMWGYVSFMYRAIEGAGPSMAALVVVSFPLVSTAGSVLFLHEALAVHEIAGGALMLYAIYRIAHR